MRIWNWLARLLLLAVLTAGPVYGAQPEVKLVAPETLKGMLADPQVVVIDVRAPGSWAKSDRKIKGAVRQDPERVALWGPTLARDKKLVLY
jgi:hypothetical protein